MNATTAEEGTSHAEEVVDEAAPPPVARILLVGKYKTEKISFETNEFETLRALKLRISAQLQIPLDRQKLIGLRHAAGGVLNDNTSLKDVLFSGVEKNLFTILGSPAQSAAAAAAASEDDSEPPDEQSEHDNYNSTEGQQRSLTLMACEEVVAAHEAVMATLNVVWIKPPVPNKKLLVLDIDYTLYDCKGASKVSNAEHLRRPYLHQFLHAIAPQYDYVLWSQTRWQWVEMKITDLGLLQDPALTPCFSLDKSQMIELPSHLVHEKSKQSSSSSRKRQVKWLRVLWEIAPNRWGPHNTIHVDDLKRNFLLNPRNGLPITPYRRNMSSYDKELLHLIRYLNRAATLADIRDWDHSQWRSSEHASL